MTKENGNVILTEEEFAGMADKMDLIGIANALESLHHLVGELMDEYFYKFDGSKEEDAHWILYEYRHTRAVMLAVDEMIFQAVRKMEKLNVDVF